jgi:hypothetical protein
VVWCLGERDALVDLLRLREERLGALLDRVDQLEAMLARQQLVMLEDQDEWRHAERWFWRSR